MNYAKHTLEEDRMYFKNHSLDRLLEIAWEWIHSARGMVKISAIDGVSGAKKMTDRAHRLLELALERMGSMSGDNRISTERRNMMPDHSSTEIHDDLAGPPALSALLEMLYAASSHLDQSRIARALDCLLAYADHWRASSPEHVATLFEQLDPSRLTRSIGQTLLASTRCDLSVARRKFLSRFLEDLHSRGAPEAQIARLRAGLEPCNSDPCSKCGAPSKWDEQIKHVEAQLIDLTAQLEREVESSDQYHRLFAAVKTDRDAWKKAYLDLKTGKAP
jgi:hypothetical protein